MNILLLSIAGSIIAAVVGTIWYSPGTPMGKLHMQFLGFDKLSQEEQEAKMKEAKPKMKKMYALQMLLSLLTAYAVVFIIVMSVQNKVSFSYALGFVVVNWLCFVVPTIGSGVLWSNCDRKIAFKHFVSDSLSVLTTIVLTALLVSFFV